MTYSELYTRLRKWHRTKRGSDDVNVERTLNKAIEELGELAQAINKKNYANVGTEIADVGIVLMTLAWAFGTDLLAEMASKVLVLEERLTKKKGL